MNNLDRQYQDLLKSIINYGTFKSDRTCTGTKSIFGYTIRHSMSDGFPLLTTKKMAWKSIITELLWFLKGDTNIKYLVDNDCHIWDGDAYKNFKVYADTVVKGYMEGDILGSQPSTDRLFSNPDDLVILSKEEFIKKIKTDDDFAKEWGELGPIYGKQWRQWQGWMTTSQGEMGSIWYDQISRIINQLRVEPDSRRMIVNAWNVADMDEMVLPPCHYGFQLYTRQLTYEERLKIWLKNNYESGFEHTLNAKVNFDDEHWEPTPERAISLMWNQRSVDTFLGLPFNIASYALLLMLFGKLTHMVPDQLIGNLGDTHLYVDHIDQAKLQIERVPFSLPDVEMNFDFKFRDGYLVDWEKIKNEEIILKNYQSHPTIKANLSN